MTADMLTALKTLRLTVLVDDVSPRTGLRAEHGFAALIETDRGVLLFDAAGSPEVLLHNAGELGVELSRIEAVVLSHGHYDHTGGLAKVLEAAPGTAVYMHPQASAKRFGQRFGIKKSIGMAEAQAAAAEARRPTLVTAPTMLPQGVVLSGPIPGPDSPAEDGFLVEVGQERVPDRFIDEMFVLAETSSGFVLVTGCCHRGLSNTLGHASALSRGKPIRTVLGGLHLARLTEGQLDASIAALQSAGVAEVIAGHCTGKKALTYLRTHASFKVKGLQTGFVREW